MMILLSVLHRRTLILNVVVSVPVVQRLLEPAVIDVNIMKGLGQIKPHFVEKLILQG